MANVEREEFLELISPAVHHSIFPPLADSIFDIQQIRLPVAGRAMLVV
jgi:hypothetical protein